MVSKKSNSTFRRVGLIFVTLFMAIFVMACSEKEVAVTDVTLNETDFALYVGEYKVLEATVSPEDATDKTVTWTSSDSDVATVNNGVVEAISAGEATITAKSGDKSATVTVTVSERVIEYTVTFDVNGGSEVAAQTVVEGETADEPEEPTRDGFEFDGWYVNDEEFDFDTAITQDTEIYAKWLEIFEVTFESNGGSEVEVQEVVDGDRIVKPLDPTREGYTFEGWYLDAALTKPYDILTPVSGDLTLYAKWEIITYTIVFSGTDEVQTINHGDKATMVELEKDGFVLEGWYTDAGFTNKFDFDVPVTADATLYAKWDYDPDVYTEVTFEIGGGDWSFGAVQMFFAGIDEANSHKLGFFNATTSEYLAFYPTTVFLGDPDGPRTQLAWVNIAGIKKNAVGLYEVAAVFGASGSTTDCTQFDYFIYAHDGYPAGYAFVGSLEVGQLVTLEGFDVANAEAGEIDATLRVYPAGTPIDTSKSIVKVNGSLPTPVKEGFVFGGWYNDTEFTGEPVTSVSESTTLYAKWVNTYEVNFGDDAPAQEVAEGEKAEVPAKPTKDGYYFRGWYADEELTTLFDFNTAITEDTTVYAKWDEYIAVETDDIDYNAVWNEDRGTWYIKVTVPEEDLDAEAVKSIKVLEEAGEALAEPRVLTPDTEKVMWFAVSKVDSDLSLKEAGLYAYEVVRADDSIYVFAFNYEPSNVEGLTEVVYAETNYEAVLNDGKYYIKMTAPGEDLDQDSIKSITVVKEAGKLLDEPKAAVLDDDKDKWLDVADENKDLSYREAGELACRVVRNDDSEFILKFDYNPNMVVGLLAELAEVDYNAVWNNVLGTYYIKVDPSEDLDVNNVESIKVLAEAGEDLETPRALTPNTDKVMWFAVAKGDGDLTYKAPGRYTYEVVLKDGSTFKFEFYYNPKLVGNVLYPVTFDANSGTILGRDQIGTYVKMGETIAEPPKPAKIGYDFKGWYLGENEFDFGQPITEPITLVAKWEITKYSITYVADGGKIPYESKNEMIVDFLTDFYNYAKGESEDFDSLNKFMHGTGEDGNELTEGFDGTWHSEYVGKLHDATRPTAPDDSKGLFIYSTEYYAKWLPFFDMIQDFVKAVNSGQNFYGDSFVGNIRLRQYVIDKKPASWVADEIMAMMPETFVQKDTYTINDNVILPVFRKEGVEFGGWYDNPEFEGSAITEIPAGSTGNLTLYAKWVEAE